MNNSKEIKKALEGNFDHVSLKKNGTVVVRRTYFYTFGKSSADLLVDVKRVLAEANVQCSELESGNHYAPFRGGASVAASSHWYVNIYPMTSADVEVK